MKRLLIIACIATTILFGFVSRPAYAFGDTYIVQPGDSLFTIATRYGINVNDLAAANGLSHDFWIYAGQELMIPVPMPSPFFGGGRQSVEPRWVNFGPPPGMPGPADYYSVPLDELRWGAPPPFDESILTRPALPPPPGWGFYDNAAPQSWQPYPAPQPDFYDVPPSAPYRDWPNPADERWIDVDLTNQILTAFEGQRPVYRSLVSSGLPQYPTVVGTFSIYVKYAAADMSGGAGDDAYSLANVPYVMYFHGNYGLHGTYWHNNFGQPMSHGCVNLPTPAAEWLFYWASVGTSVVTHY